MSQELADAIARRFIARADAKAKQYPDGEYKPVRSDPRDMKSATVKWSRDDILAHLNKSDTYGHYFLDSDNTTKLYAFDIDLETTGMIPTRPLVIDENLTDEHILAWENSFAEGNPREAWRIRSHPARPYLKAQFRELAEALAKVIHEVMETETAVAYSGNKGVHVYGFTGRYSAEAVREAAETVLDVIGGFSLQEKRASTFKHDTRWQHMSIEVFPKQIELSGGGFGNLMRLPLGINTKAPKDPTFFVDLTAPLAEFRPTDPLRALTDGAKNPWAMPS